MEILLAAVVAAAVSAVVVLATQRSHKVPAPAGGLPAQADGHAERRRAAQAPQRADDGARRTSSAPGAPSLPGSRSGCGPRRARSTRGSPNSTGVSVRSTTVRGISRPGQRAEGGEARPGARAGAAVGPERRPGEADPAAGARGRAAPRERPPDPPGGGGDQARRRSARAQHPRRVHAAGRERARGRDDRVGGRAGLGRAEGPHHRPRGAQHPHPRDPHRDRLHHRRHPGRGPALRLRRRPARDRRG